MVCFALNTLLDILYEKTESIWVPAIAHGAFNAIAALPQVLVTPADAYYNVLGPMPIGLIAALPMLAAAVWLTLREMKQEERTESQGNSRCTFCAAAVLAQKWWKKGQNIP